MRSSRAVKQSGLLLLLLCWGGAQDAQASGGALHSLARSTADQAPGRSGPGVHVEVQDGHAIVQQRIQPRSIQCSEQTSPHQREAARPERTHQTYFTYLT